MQTMRSSLGFRAPLKAAPCQESVTPHVLAAKGPILRSRLIPSQVPHNTTASASASSASSNVPPVPSFSSRATAVASKKALKNAEPPRMGEAARLALTRAIEGVNRFGWLGFWMQLSLTIISVVIIIFSVAFSIGPSGPKASYALTMVGIMAGIYSCFWSYGYTRLGRRMKLTLAGIGTINDRIKRQEVFENIAHGVFVNCIGMGSTLLGIQSVVGTLVSQTLTAATAPSMITSSATYNPVMPLDVFLVQAATNTFLGHFLCLACSLWLLFIVSDGRGEKFQRLLSLGRLRKRVESNKRLTISKGNAQTFKVDRNFEYIQNKSDRTGESVTAGGAPVRSRSKAIVGTGSSATAAAYAMAASKLPVGKARNINCTTDIITPTDRVSDEEAIVRRGDDILLFPTVSSLQYLDGTLPGDFGFDPLELFSPANGNAGLLNQRWLLYTEIIHSRWAMLGALGVLAPQYLGNQMAGDETMWWTVLTPEVNGVYSETSVKWRVALLSGLAVVEALRLADFNQPGSLERGFGLGGLEKSLTSKFTDDPMYPGGPLFNALGIVRDSSSSQGFFKEGELVNGRIAMLAMLGFTAQAIVTGEGPLKNLADHLLDPVGINIVSMLEL